MSRQTVRQRPCYRLELRHEGDGPPEVALRLLLKSMLRNLGFRCTGALELKADDGRGKGQLGPSACHTSDPGAILWEAKGNIMANATPQRPADDRPFPRLADLPYDHEDMDRRREQALYEGLTTRGQKFRAAKVHAKLISLAFSDGNFATVETSANFAENMNAEHYVVANDAGLHAFHRGWVTDLLTGERDKRELEVEARSAAALATAYPVRPAPPLPAPVPPPNHGMEAKPCR